MGSLVISSLYQQLCSLTRGSLVFWTGIASITIIVLASKLFEPETVKVPTFSFTGPFIPKTFSRLKFTTSASTVIYGGYKKYKDKPYRLLKPDGDLIVISNKHSEELRALPHTKLNALEAAFSVCGNERDMNTCKESREADTPTYGPSKNFLGSYTSVLVGSQLHTEAVQKRLNPGLTRVMPRLIDELRHAFEVEFPKCEDTWVPIKLYEVIVRLVARSGSRIFVGEPLCRDKAWLDASITFASNFFETVAILRGVPGFLHPVVSKLLPSYWRLKIQLEMVKEKLLIPIINERRAAERSGVPGYEKPDDYLQWMMDLAENENEAEAGNLAHRTLALTSMAVVHTSAMATVHVIYDLITMPKYLEPLRTEIKEMLPKGWEESTQPALSGMNRLDSFMKESQRMNPPALLSFHRIVKEPMTLSDGLMLPKGTHICMPSGPISMDDSVVPDAERFDGFRWFREGKGGSTFTSTGPTSMHFGLGRYACPGRFFAAYIIKAILSRILLDYEFKFDDAQRGRPKNMSFGYNVVPDFNAIVYFKRTAATTV